MEFVQLINEPDDGIDHNDSYKFGMLDKLARDRGNYKRYIFNSRHRGYWWVYPHNRSFILTLVF